MADALLVLNAGSSSLKFSVFVNEDPPRPLVRGQLEGLPERPRFVARDAKTVVAEKVWAAGARLDHEGAIDFLLRWSASELGAHRIAGAGHRVVHGGRRFAGPERIDSATLDQLKALIPLAPLHQPHNVAAIEALAAMAPSIPQVACFDTAFHRGQPAVAQTFALPRWYTAEGLHRYGFHGLSYEYVASLLPALDRRAAQGRTVVAHLGNGASLCALAGGRSIATTMGFTALDGLVMGTRCGSIDPGVLLYLIDRHGMSGSRLERLLYEESGLLGVSEISGDMRVLLDSDDPRAAEAVDLFVYRIRRELGSLAAALNGLDALIFTGGIGENAASIRARVCDKARWLGLELDGEANAAGASRISRTDSRVSAWVVPTDEELMIARHTRRLLAPAPGSATTAT